MKIIFLLFVIYYFVGLLIPIGLSIVKAPWCPENLHPNPILMMPVPPIEHCLLGPVTYKLAFLFDLELWMNTFVWPLKLYMAIVSGNPSFLYRLRI